MTTVLTNDNKMAVLSVTTLVAFAGLAMMFQSKSLKRKVPEEVTYDYNLWGKKVRLGIPVDNFPTNDEQKKMEDTMPGCIHGWFESSTEGAQLHYRKFLPSSKPKAVVVFHHGIKTHSGASFLTSNGRKLNLALQVERFVEKEGFALYAMDMYGHGYSEGRRMFINDYKSNANDLASFCRLAASEHADDTPLFLMGHSFGGALTLLVANLFQNDTESAPSGFKGIALVAPAIVADLPPPPVVFILCRILAVLYPTWTPFFMPNPVNPERIWREAEACKLHTDPQYKKMGLDTAGTPLMLQTAAECMSAVDEIQKDVIPNLKTPFCCIHGKKDYATKVEGTVYLEEKALTPKEDQSVHCLEDGYHDLFADPLAEQTMTILTTWMNDRIS
mmetsp:Transcript_30718/g.46547  ORF Transcript_30718/g.46547 Transcript_30718/m.46547 type:complete len:388 (-) Transcript_30718:1855-3018(-)